MEWRNAEWYGVISALLPLGGQQHSSVCFSVAGNTRDRKCTYKGFTWLRHKCSRAAGEMQNYLIDGLYNFQCLSVQLRGRNCFTTSKETLRLHMGGKVWWGLRRRWSSQRSKRAPHEACAELSCPRTVPASLIPSPWKLTSNIPWLLVANLLYLLVLQETKPSNSACFAKYILNSEFRACNYLPATSQLLTFSCLILQNLNS